LSSLKTSNNKESNANSTNTSRNNSSQSGNGQITQMQMQTQYSPRQQNIQQNMMTHHKQVSASNISSLFGMPHGQTPIPMPMQPQYTNWNQQSTNGPPPMPYQPYPKQQPVWQQQAAMPMHMQQQHQMNNYNQQTYNHTHSTLNLQNMPPIPDNTSINHADVQIDQLSKKRPRRTSELSEITDTTKYAGSEDSDDDSLSTTDDSSSDSKSVTQSELIAMNKNKKEKDVSFGVCGHSGCYCKQFVPVSSKWLSGKCKSCNHSQKEHQAYRAVHVTDEGDSSDSDQDGDDTNQQMYNGRTHKTPKGATDDADDFYSAGTALKTRR